MKQCSFYRKVLLRKKLYIELLIIQKIIIKKKEYFLEKEIIGTLRSETNTQKKVMTLLKIIICPSFHYKHTTQELTANPYPSTHPRCPEVLLSFAAEIRESERSRAMNCQHRLQLRILWYLWLCAGWQKWRAESNWGFFFFRISLALPAFKSSWYKFKDPTGKG